MEATQMNVDFHAHALVPDVLSGSGPEDWRPAIVPHESGGYFVQNAYHTNGPIFNPMVEPDQIIATRQAASIDLTVICTPPHAFFYELAPTEGASTVQNDGLSRVVAEHQRHLAGLGTLPLQDVVLAVKELERVMTDLGLSGVEIASNINGEDLGSERFRPFWEAAEALGAVVFIHPAFSGSIGGERMKAYDLRRIMGNLMETAQAAAHLIFSGILEAFPDLKIVLAHGGGVLPYLVGRLDHGYQVRTKPKENITRLPSTYLRMFYYDTITHYGPALRYLIDLVGVDHVLLGSDYPFDMGYDRPVEFVDRLPGLSQLDRERILGSNALRLLGRTP
jgi:aminocarboxymuconate-semialdehyde decarboxylase